MFTLSLQKMIPFNEHTFQLNPSSTSYSEDLRAITCGTESLTPPPVLPTEESCEAQTSEFHAEIVAGRILDGAEMVGM